jgi:hypothetical protein
MNTSIFKIVIASLVVASSVAVADGVEPRRPQFASDLMVADGVEPRRPQVA